MLGGIGKNQAALKGKFKNRFHNVQLVNESFGCERRAAFRNPAVTILLGDVTDWQILKIWRESFDIHFPSFDGIGTQCVFIRFQPQIRGLLEIQFRVGRNFQTANLCPQVIQSAVGQLAVFGFKRAAKLLASAL